MPCHRAEEFDLEVLFREPDSPECRDFVAHSGDCSDCTAAMQGRHEPPREITARAPNGSRLAADTSPGRAAMSSAA